MKKIFTLIAALGAFAFANAQSFVFTLDGEVLEDQAVVEINAKEYINEYTWKGEVYQETLVECGTDETFLLHNNTNTDIAYEGELTIPVNESTWEMSWCMGTTCKTVNLDALPMTINEVLPANDDQLVQYHAEIPFDEEARNFGSNYSTIVILAGGESRTVNISFNYDESCILSVKEVGNNISKEVARYSVDGTQLAKPQKGLNIVRMSNGTVKKILVK